MQHNARPRFKGRFRLRARFQCPCGFTTPWIRVFHADPAVYRAALISAVEHDRQSG